MASYKKINNIVLMLMSLVCLNSLKQVHAGDNDALVSKMCSATYAPNVCQSCIKKDQNGAKNESDVIQVVLKCGEADSLQLQVDVNKAIDDRSTDQKTKSTLFSINPLISDFIASAGTVQQQAMLNKFDDARASIKNLIMAKVTQCDNMLAALGVTIPPAVFSGFFNVEAYYKLSDQLIASVQVAQTRGAIAQGQQILGA